MLFHTNLKQTLTNRCICELTDVANCFALMRPHSRETLSRGCTAADSSFTLCVIDIVFVNVRIDMHNHIPNKLISSVSKRSNCAFSPVKEVLRNVL